MKSLVLLVAVAIIGFVSARPEDVSVLKSENDIKDDGSFSYTLELTDGTFITQSGKITNPSEPDPEKQILAVEGSYRFTDPKTGQVVNVKYIADENGYQPTVSRK